MCNQSVIFFSFLFPFFFLFFPPFFLFFSLFFFFFLFFPLFSSFFLFFSPSLCSCRLLSIRGALFFFLFFSLFFSFFLFFSLFSSLFLFFYLVCSRKYWCLCGVSTWNTCARTQVGTSVTLSMFHLGPK